MMTPQERGQKAARSRTFRKRWLEAVDGVKKRGLLIHDIKPGQRGAELAALDHSMRSLQSLVTELQMSNVMSSE